MGPAVCKGGEEFARICRAVGLVFATVMLKRIGPRDIVAVKVFRRTTLVWLDIGSRPGRSPGTISGSGGVCGAALSHNELKLWV